MLGDERGDGAALASAVDVNPFGVHSRVGFGGLEDSLGVFEHLVEVELREKRLCIKLTRAGDLMLVVAQHREVTGGQGVTDVLEDAREFDGFTAHASAEDRRVHVLGARAVNQDHGR